MIPQTPGIVTRLTGGLGNQLFQYALGRALAIQHHCPLYLDLAVYQHYTLHRYSLGPYCIQAEMFDENLGKRHARFLMEFPPHVQLLGRLDRLVRPHHFLKTYVEKGARFDPKVLTLQPPCYLTGFWQSEKYFLAVRPQLLEDLAVRTPQQGRDLEVASDILASDAICLHVRRGDYVSDQRTQQVHGTCSSAYYEKALGVILPQCNNPAVFVFSDDPAWARQNITPPVRTVYVDHNGPDKNYEDLRLMSQCKHNITANSSFSWWGAWLGQREGKIVCCPSRWFQHDNWSADDLFPPQWNRL